MLQDLSVTDLKSKFGRVVKLVDRLQPSMVVVQMPPTDAAVAEAVVALDEVMSDLQQRGFEIRDE